MCGDGELAGGTAFHEPQRLAGVLRVYFAKSLKQIVAKRCAARFRADAGMAAVEFAFVAPVLVAIIVCTGDLGLAFYRKMQVQNAAQAGAQYVALHGFTDATSISAAVTGATTFSGISASPAPTQFCGCPSTSGVTSTSCTSTCTGGSSPGKYVTVSAQASYTTLISYPGIPSSFTFRAQPTVRVQ